MKNTNESTPMTAMNGNIFQRVQPGKCRIALNGQIAVETGSGYKTFSTATNTLTNCSSFVSAIGDDFFYVVPAMKVKPGDIILLGGLPRCVISHADNRLTVMTYETGSIETILPERQMFMGNIYFFNKIISPMLGMFGNGKGKMNRMIKLMMMSDMMGGGKGTGLFGGNAGNGGGMNLMQLMMMQGMMKEMGNSFEDMFTDFSDLGEDADDDDADDPLGIA